MRTQFRPTLILVAALITGLSAVYSANEKTQNSPAAAAAEDPLTAIFDDSKWTLQGYTTSSRLKGMIDTKATEPDAIFVVVFYRVQNLSKKNDPILFGPKLKDSEGNVFDAMADEGLYMPQGRKSISLETINPKLTKSFCAIYEVPKSSTDLAFGARSLADDELVEYIPLKAVTRTPAAK